MTFSFLDYKNAHDFLAKHPGLSMDDAIEFLDTELRKLKGATKT